MPELDEYDFDFESVVLLGPVRVCQLAVPHLDKYDCELVVLHGPVRVFDLAVPHLDEYDFQLVVLLGLVRVLSWRCRIWTCTG